jgi:hypothetical protein
VNKIRNFSNNLVKISGYDPLLSIENFFVEVFATIEINSKSEPGLAVNLWLREWILPI